MLRLLREALSHGPGPRATPAPDGGPVPGLRGQVEIDFARCTLDGACVEACPTPAIRLENDPSSKRATLTLDLGPCVFCGLCEDACGAGAVKLTGEWRLAARRREDLVTRGHYGASGAASEPPAPNAGATAAPPDTADATAAALRRRAQALLGRALAVRAVDAGSCNGCESELRAAAGPAHELTRHGIELVIAPSHADLLLVTGPVTRAMEAPLRAAYAEIAPPKLVVALGACTMGGGIHHGSYGHSNGLPSWLPADVLVPGCPPRPQAILHGLLLALERVTPRVSAASWRGPYPGGASPISVPSAVTE